MVRDPGRPQVVRADRRRRRARAHADGDRPAVPGGRPSEQREALLEVKEALEAQAPKGAAPDPFERSRSSTESERGKAGDRERSAHRPSAEPRDGGEPDRRRRHERGTAPPPRRSRRGSASTRRPGSRAQQAAELLAEHGPNALPAEQPVPGWRRFLGQYRSYMQIILVGAAIVSLAIKEWSTGVAAGPDHRAQRGRRACARRARPRAR